ncbi:MAG TPA: hypothetical protein VFV01_06945 [Spirillospora sp.]|nr:hypothetical protein [Spirillospora sp.]
MTADTIDTNDYAARAEQIRADHDRTLERVRAAYTDKRLTAEARDNLIAKSHLKTQAALEELRTAVNTQRTRTKQDLERRMFVPDTKDGNDPATRATSFRQARAQADALGDGRAIRAELLQAARSGDTLLAKAILQRAHDLAVRTQDKSLVETIVGYVNEYRPDLRQTYMDLVDMEREDKSVAQRFQREAAFMHTIPTELGRYQAQQIEQIAADPRFTDTK